MHGKLKKLFSVLIIFGVVLAFCLPAFASTGITCGRAFWDEAENKYKIGSQENFLGHRWTLWKIDGDNLCFITSQTTGFTVYHPKNDPRDFDLGYYSRSNLHNVVVDVEKKMQSYSGAGKNCTEILTWSLINGGTANYIAHSPTSEDGVAEDYLYIPSRDEVERMPKSISAIGVPWWTRTQTSWHAEEHLPATEWDPYFDAPPQLRIFIVNKDGAFEKYRHSSWLHFRVAMTINKNSPLFQPIYPECIFKTAAEGGKADVVPGTGFCLPDYSGYKWKYTIESPHIARPRIVVFYKDDEKLSLEFNAAIGKNMYLSALLYDEKGKLVNYAKVAHTRTTGRGMADLPIDNIPSGKYNIKFFCEQINGNGEADYASELSEDHIIEISHQQQSQEFKSSIFKKLSDIPKITGDNSATIRYDLKNWAKISDKKLLLHSPINTLSWKDAVSQAERYADHLNSSYERNIAESSALLPKKEAEKLTQNERSFFCNWWLASSVDPITPYRVNSSGEFRSATISNYPNAGTRIALNLKNTDTIYFLNSADSGAKNIDRGQIISTPDSGKEWKITYKNDELPAPAFNELTLDAQGNSIWHTQDEHRIAALIGGDGADAKGYTLMKTNGGDNGILLNGLPEEKMYIHAEITGRGYDVMSAKSTELQLPNLRYKNGCITGMTLSKKIFGADNSVTLKNGFALALEDKQLYGQDIISAQGTNVLIGNGEQGAKTFGNITVSSGSQLNCKGTLHFTTLQLDGVLMVGSGATVTLTDKPSKGANLLHTEANGLVANIGNEPIDVYDITKERVISIPCGYYYVGGQKTEYCSIIDWEEPAWEDANGGEFEEGEKGGSSSSGGCNAGFGALALLALVLLARTKNDERRAKN